MTTKVKNPKVLFDDTEKHILKRFVEELQRSMGDDRSSGQFYGLALRLNTPEQVAVTKLAEKIRRL